MPAASVRTPIRARRRRPFGPMFAARTTINGAAWCGSIRDQHEVHLHARLAGARIELGDERFVARRGHAGVEMEGSAGVAAREVCLVAVAPGAVPALSGAVLGVVGAARG